MSEETSNDKSPVESGAADSGYSGKNIRTTLAIIFGMMLAAIIFGAFSTIQGRGRLNDNVLPRALEYYGIYPGGSVHYISLIHPAELVMVDDEADFDPYEVDMVLPALEDPGDIMDAETFGGTLVNTSDDKQVYTLLRELRDGQYFGINAHLVHLPARGDQSFTLTVHRQTDYAQKILVVGLPLDTSEPSNEGELTPYRVTRLDNWQLYYYDLTLLDGESTISLTWKANGSIPSTDLTALRLDENR